MQSTSLLCSSNSLSLSLSFSTSQRLSAPLQNGCGGPVGAPCCTGRAPLNCSQIPQRNVTPVRSTVLQEIIETSKSKAEFVEIGYVCSVHGLQGEVRIQPSTGFPELRFSKPGRRWLKQVVSGREISREVELSEGRAHPGKKSWIVKFNDIDTVDQAQMLIGSTVLVTEEDKPELEEGEFYSRDLIGMRVTLKETGESVGTVVNVFNSGASDLLHVMLNSSAEGGASAPLVWVPFVEAIVPCVDTSKREMLITPPKGLLELNIRSHEKSKKERRELEWKERKKFQQRVIAAKKRLSAMEQQHVFHGFRVGGKAQGRLLAEQIVNVNSKLLQQALHNIKLPSERWNLHELVEANLAKHAKSALRISEKCLANFKCGETPNTISGLQENGQLLVSQGKYAVILHTDNWERKINGFAPDLVDKDYDCSRLLAESFFHDNRGLVKIEDRASVPLILVCPADEVQSLQSTFANHNYFAFNSEKVWFLEEEKLPVISKSIEEEKKHKILMKSPWEILQAPVGSGGVISLLSSDNILENLSNMGVEYIQVYSVNTSYIGGYSLLGLISSRKANIGVQVSKDANYLEDNCSVVFSLKFLKHLTNHMNKLDFHAIAKSHQHVEKVDREWIDVAPLTPNSYELYCSIYSSISACPPGKVCLMEVTS